MTIRTRLTFWYAGILFISLLIIGALTYHERVIEGRQRATEAGSEDEAESWGDVVQIIAWCGLPAALIGIGGGWFLMRKALAPVSALTEAAAKIHDRNLHNPLPRTNNGDEIDQLTGVFNSMIARLDNSFQQIREFTLHASHELKTPLTVMRAQMETQLREDSPADPHRERLLNQIDEILRLTKIVDGLSLLTKADAGQITLSREPVRLDEIVRDGVEDAQMLGRDQNVTVSLGNCDAVTLPGDRHRLRQLLLNLTDNAVKYNYAGGSVKIDLRRLAGDTAELRISNTGPGIPAGMLPHVFERFFRGDSSHNNAVEGCGLGLSIAQWIVHAHGGTIELQSTPDTLTIVTMRLPVQPE